MVRFISRISELIYCLVVTKPDFHSVNSKRTFFIGKTSCSPSTGDIGNLLITSSCESNILALVSEKQNFLLRNSNGDISGQIILNVSPNYISLFTKFQAISNI